MNPTTILRKLRGALKLSALIALAGWTAREALRRPGLRASETALARGDHLDALRLALDDLRVFRLSRASSLVAARAFSREIYPDDAEPFYRFAARFGALPLDSQHDRIKGLVRGLKTEEGVALCRQVLEGHPDDPETLTYLATAEWKEGRLPEAREAAERLTRVGSRADQVSGFDLLASVHRGADRRDQAVEACEAILKIDPDLKLYRPSVSGFWTEFAEDLVLLRRPAEARDHLARVIGPYSDPVLLDILGSAFRDLRDPDSAAKAWRESIRRDPSRINPWLRLGSLEIDRKRFADAAEILEKAVAVEPDHYGANYLLERAYRLMKRADDANRQLKRVEKLRPTTPGPGGMGPSS